MATARKRELEELLEQKRKEMAEIEAALQAEGKLQGRETAEETKMASSPLSFASHQLTSYGFGRKQRYIELMTFLSPDNDPSQTQLYLPHKFPALLVNLHDAMEVLNDRMEYYQTMSELVDEMAMRHPNMIRFDLINEKEISSLVYLARCLKWDEDVASKLKRSVVPDVRLIRNLRDKVVGEKP